MCSRCVYSKLKQGLNKKTIDGLMNEPANEWINKWIEMYDLFNMNEWESRLSEMCWWFLNQLTNQSVNDSIDHSTSDQIINQMKSSNSLHFLQFYDFILFLICRIFLGMAVVKCDGYEWVLLQLCNRRRKG